jgi:hypothetical protein
MVKCGLRFSIFHMFTLDHDIKHKHAIVREIGERILLC